MSNSFWQIWSPRFLLGNLPCEGNIEKSLRDLIRNQLNIYFNGVSLYQLLQQKLGSKNIMEIKDLTTPDILKTIFAEQLLSFCSDPFLKQFYLERLGRVLYQWGLLFAASQSLIEINGEDRGYLLGGDNFSDQVNIYEKKGQIYIEEKVVVRSIKSMSLGQQETCLISNSDDSPMMTVKSRIHLHPMGDGEMAYYNTDLVLEYNSDLMRSLYDKRSLLEKIVDFIKSCFLLNRIEDFSLDELEQDVAVLN